MSKFKLKKCFNCAALMPSRFANCKNCQRPLIADDKKYERAIAMETKRNRHARKQRLAAEKKQRQRERGRKAGAKGARTEAPKPLSEDEVKKNHDAMKVNIMNLPVRRVPVKKKKKAKGAMTLQEVRNDES